MRKNDLIKLLQELKGNPEVVLWNGYAGDYMHIDKKFIESDLCKPTLETAIMRYRHERCIDEKDWNYQLTQDEIKDMTKCYRKNYEWEINRFVTTDDIKRKLYKSKKIVVINAKRSGKTTFDRLGQVEY
jgi:RecA-family ATPase